MRLEERTQERAAGFDVGDKISVQYDTRRGSLSIMNGTVLRKDSRGVLLSTGTAEDLVPVLFSWDSIKTIGRKS